MLVVYHTKNIQANRNINFVNVKSTDKYRWAALVSDSLVRILVMAFIQFFTVSVEGLTVNRILVKSL